MHCVLESRADQQESVLARFGPGLAAFLSFSAMRGFGANHPLIALADRLHESFGVRMGPFSTFYEGDPEDSEDVERLEQAWQAARDLSASAAPAARALQTDQQCQALIARAEVPELGRELSELADLLQGLDPGTLVRLTYFL